MQDGFFTVDDQRVAGVVATLKPHDDVRTLGQPIDDLALALVTPLGTHNYDVRHAKIPERKQKPRRNAGV